MNYVSFDIETTGLDPDRHAILEAAFVVDGEDYYHLPLVKLPWNTMLVVQDDYFCNPFVAMMHTKNGLWADIERARSVLDGSREFDIDRDTPARDNVVDAVMGLFAQAGSVVGNKVVLTGKNVASFDLAFLKANGIIDHSGAFINGYRYDDEGNDITPCQGMKIAHRCLDVGPLYFQRGLDAVPDTKMCCELAGLPAVNSNHRAYGDCIQVAALIRKKVLGKLCDEDLDYLVKLSEAK